MTSPHDVPVQRVKTRVRLRPRGFRRVVHALVELRWVVVRALYSWLMRPLRPIRRERFEALVGFGRHPMAKVLTPELEWYRTKGEALLGVICVDIVDEDFYAALLGRDSDRRFRWVAGEGSIVNVEEARKILTRLARENLKTGQTAFPQGDEAGKKQDIFDPIPNKKLHPSFVIVKHSSGHASARELISEMMHHYVDVDGNFIEQFQTTGFDSRLWELYLFAYFNEETLLTERPKPAPDFVVSRGQHKAAIEAVTVSRTQGGEVEDTAPERMSPERVKELTNDYMPIKFGSSLFSKLQKKYWDLPAAKDLPLVFAIADFHEKHAMTWTSTALTRYLYGVPHDFTYDDEGQLVISPIKIAKHLYKGKEIPSGFFFQPNAEHISAVLFSASGTISKFTRLGKLAGFGDRDVRIVRFGTNHHHDPNAALPDQFMFEVDERYYSETWAEGVSIFHNPNARIPLPHELFPAAAHHRFENGQIVSVLPEFHPYGSTTMIYVPERKRVAEQAAIRAASE
jgi:hypothetical protein